MSRDGSGVYHRPVGTDAVTDTTIESTKYNINVADVEQDLNLPRPIVAGGTAATSADGALDSLSAEKFKQVITNWDSTTWRAGSFYAATTASGTAPVAGHAFAGIAYYANTTDLVLEARDLTDVSDPTIVPHYIRVMTAGVWGPWIRTAGGSSAAASVGEYTFDNTITFPPLAGQVRFNNATQNSATEIFISRTTATNINVSNLLPFSIKSGYDILVQDKDEPAKYKIFTATADPVLSGGDYRVTAVFKSGGTDIVSAQRVLVGSTSGISATTYAVRYDIAQSLVAPQQQQARQNIFAAPLDALAYNGLQVNGGFEIGQEKGLNTQTTTNGGYIVDGWLLSTTVSTAVYNWAQYDATTFFTAAGAPRCIAMVTSTAQPSLGATEVVAIQHSIEGTRCSRLQWGTANAQPLTIGFWTGHTKTAGVYSLAIRNPALNRSYVTTYVQNVGNTSEYKTVTIPGCTDGVWPIDNTACIIISLTFACGAAYIAPAPNTWYSTNYIAAPGQINGVATTPDIYRLSGIVVLAGSEAPSATRPYYILRPFPEELRLCQRYYEKTYNYAVLPQTSTPNGMVGGLAQGAITNLYSSVFFKSPKRVAPTITVYSGLGGAGQFSTGVAGTDSINSASAVNISENGFILTNAATGSTGVFCHYVANARI